MASTALRSSKLFLYAEEDVTVDDKKVQIDVSNAEVDFQGPQDVKFDFGSYKFKEGESYYDLETRFSALEGDQSSSTNAAAISQLQTDLAAETVSRQSADTTNSNAISAEITARTTAVSGVQSSLDSQIASQQADHATALAAVQQEVSDRQAAVSAEAASRASDIAGLQSQITNVLGGALASDLDSLSEIIAAYQAGDTTLANQAASMLPRITQLEQIVSELTSHSI